MQLRHVKTAVAPTTLSAKKDIPKVTSIAFAHTGAKFAVSTVDRYVLLFDADGTQRDRFPTKPCKSDAPKNSYTVRALAFSPDSTKIAVAQSDGIVFIYAIGEKWGDKKSICNKFPAPAPVTALAWPKQRVGEIVFGLANGEVRVGLLRNNKSAVLYTANATATPQQHNQQSTAASAYVVALSPSPGGNSFVSGHLDGAVYRYAFPTGQVRASQKRITTVEYAPYALAWGEHICTAGNNHDVHFFDPESGRLAQSFNFARSENNKEFTCAAVNPTGHAIVVGNCDRFLLFAYKMSSQKWQEAVATNIENLYSVTALAWRPDGGSLVTGSVFGAVDVYEACVRRYLYKGTHEFTYTSLSSVIVKHLESGKSTALQSNFGYELLKVHVRQGRYLLANTLETLIVSDLETGMQSEVPWNPSGREKFYFDLSGGVLVFHGGELSIIEFGSNDILGYARTEHVNAHLVSLCITSSSPLKQQDAGVSGLKVDVKKLAYLLDAQTIRVQDLVAHATDATVNHDSRIDWLELNQSGTKLLFRDRRRALHLYDIATQQRTTLLNYCNYAQWVPNADVAVAQSRRNLCVWYSVHQTHDVTIIPIKGDVEDIQRDHTKTEVLVDEGMTRVAYPLNEALISFGAAVKVRDFHSAAATLEALPGDANDAMWAELSKLALETKNYVVAERCAAALGDIARARYLHKVNQDVFALQDEGGVRHYAVQAQIAILEKNFKRAEAIYLHEGATEDAIAMYKRLHKWGDALRIAESRNHPNAAQLRDNYYQYLLHTHQEEVAGELKERDGDHAEALRLYLRGGFPVLAADLVLRQGMTHDANVLETVASALLKSGKFEKAGEFLEGLRLYKRALDAYVRGKCFHRAVDLSRAQFPGQVVRLEEEWADHLVSVKQMDAACNHYIQAGVYIKAVNAAIEARQWSKALQILDQIDITQAKPYFRRVADQLAILRKFSEAERCFIKCGNPEGAVRMYTKAGKWDLAHRLATKYMRKEDVSTLYVSQAQLLESQNKFKEAEQLYVRVNEPDLAINMYKKQRQYDDMVRLVKEHRANHLNDTHLHLAHQFEKEGQFRIAEKHYLSADVEWQHVIDMYKEHNMWEDALRVAKSHGGQQVFQKLSYEFATSVGGEQGVKQLQKQELGEQAVDYAILLGEFDKAFEIAEKSAPHRLKHVHYSYGMALEDEGRYEVAEREFIEANKPKEAIDMYLHQQEWAAAMSIAEKHDPSAMASIYAAQGESKAKAQDFRAAEGLFLSAKQPLLAIKMYKEAGKWDEALKIAGQHAPHIVHQLEQERRMGKDRPMNTARGGAANAAAMGVGGTSGGAAAAADGLLKKAKSLVQNHKFNDAIDVYLQITKEHTREYDALERIWENAVALAMEYVPTRVNEVVPLVAHRLVDIDRIEAAAEIYMGIERFSDAIDVFLRAKMFDRAREVAKGTSAVMGLQDRVEKAYQLHLVQSDHVHSSDLGGIDAGAQIDVYVQRNEWDKAYALAERQGNGLPAKYAALHGKLLAKDGRYREAMSVLAAHGMAVVPGNFELFKRIATEVLAQSEEKAPSDGSIDPTTVDSEFAIQLRDVLYKLVQEISGMSGSQSSVHLKEFQHLLEVAHLNCMRLSTMQQGLRATSAKISVALLRYCREIPIDKAFYDAGWACRDQQWSNLAFVFFNRFVDVTDLMEDPNHGDIDNTDFLCTDIPSPFNVPLPPRQNFTEDCREEVRDWVLDKAVDSSVAQQLSMRRCGKCMQDTYVAALTCHNCRHSSPACVVTGYPVLDRDRVQCTSCRRYACRDDWNQYVLKMKSCPWCKATQHPNY